MTFDELINFYGTQAAAAEVIGLKQPSVAEWKKEGIPHPRQCQYQILTDGKLMADPLQLEARA